MSTARVRRGSMALLTGVAVVTAAVAVYLALHRSAVPPAGALARVHRERTATSTNAPDLESADDAATDAVARRFAQLDTALRAEPRDAEAFEARIHLSLAHRPAEAVPALRALLEREPDSTYAHEHLVAAYLAQGLAANARTAAARAVRARDGIAHRLLLADTFARTGDPGSAASQYRVVLERDPDNGAARRALDALDAASGQ